MYYFAYIDADNICTGVYAMPSDLSGTPGYITITEEQYTSQSVVGMRWNAETSTWEDPTTYYYAILNENDIVVEISDEGQEIIDDYYIRIDELDQTLIGKRYDRETETFVEVQFKDIAAHSTDDINVGTTNTVLTEALDAKANAADVYTKTEVDNAIANAGTGSGSGSGTAGADGEDGGYYQPAVAEDGTLSWTASKTDMPAVASVNIKGADGAPGEAGAAGQDGTTVVVGTVTTLEAGESATVQGVLNAETNTLALNFGIPRGEQGEAGDAASVDAYTKTEVDTMIAGKADSSHSHIEYATTAALDNKADSDHTHSEYATTSQLDGKADSSHTHSEYASSSHTHSNYASSTHTHSGYATSTHTHTGYLSTSGGTVSGNLTVSGVFYVGGVQAVYNSGSQMILGTGNLATTIACASSSDVTVNGARMQIPSLLPRNGGSFQIGNTSYRFSGIYLTNSPNVSSDARCKEDVAAVNVSSILDFVNKLSVCTYKYKDDPTARIGLVAQEVLAADETQAKFYVEHDAETDLYSLKPADLVFPLIAAVQALAKRVEALEQK